MMLLSNRAKDLLQETEKRFFLKKIDSNENVIKFNLLKRDWILSYKRKNRELDDIAICLETSQLNEEEMAFLAGFISLCLKKDQANLKYMSFREVENFLKDENHGEVFTNSEKIHPLVLVPISLGIILDILNLQKQDLKPYELINNFVEIFNGHLLKINWKIVPLDHFNGCAQIGCSLLNDGQVIDTNVFANWLSSFLKEKIIMNLPIKIQFIKEIDC